MRLGLPSPLMRSETLRAAASVNNSAGVSCNASASAVLIVHRLLTKSPYRSGSLEAAAGSRQRRLTQIPRKPARGGAFDLIARSATARGPLWRHYRLHLSQLARVMRPQ